MMKTYNEIYLKARKALQQGGMEDYSLDAKLLVSAVCHKSVSQFISDLGLYTTEEVEKQVEDAVWRRLSGEPIAYITESWEFYGLPLYINKNVLIPRPDTELIIDTAKEILEGRLMDARILDLCCGSGCITCALAKEFPAARFVSADLSGEALEVARKNISELGFGSRVVCMNSDALSNPPFGIGMFDLIVSNPPYIPSAEIESLSPSVKDYEPIMALDGGNDGLKFYRAIIRFWKTQLKESGFILFEVGEEEAEPVQEMLMSAGFKDTDYRMDSIGVKRVVIGQK